MESFLSRVTEKSFPWDSWCHETYYNWQFFVKITCQAGHGKLFHKLRFTNKTLWNAFVSCSCCVRECSSQETEGHQHTGFSRCQVWFFGLNAKIVSSLILNEEIRIICPKNETSSTSLNFIEATKLSLACSFLIPENSYWESFAIYRRCTGNINKDTNVIIYRYLKWINIAGMS